MPKESKKFINPLLRPSQDVIAPPQSQDNPATKVPTEEVHNEGGQTLPSEKPSEKTLPSIDLPALPSTGTSPLPSTTTSPSTDRPLETVILGDVQSEVSTSKSRPRGSGKRNVPEQTWNSAIIQSDPDRSTTIAEAGKERPTFKATELVRRKRGPLAFEKTHERITLWIDKGLKQAFEELAYEQELPKAALLNEAIADLLKKYDLH